MFDVCNQVICKSFPSNRKVTSYTKGRLISCLFAKETRPEQSYLGKNSEHFLDDIYVQSDIYHLLNNTAQLIELYTAITIKQTTDYGGKLD